ncbi:MAG: PocR ligand-binding domain-containing protein [Desulfuromonadaceae bacterium]|nr:PocR ligand-binding domain-containing protein [Desulfuromonadaceae bacterium]
MAYLLKELIDVPQLQLLLDSLYEINGMSSSVLEADGTILLSSGWQDVCTEFHRGHPDSEKKCIESDQHFEITPGGDSSHGVYRCPMGLVDSAAPIIIDGALIGNVIIGQLFLQSPDEAYFADQARQYGFDERAYMEAVRKVPIFTKETVYKNLGFLRNLVQMEADHGVQRKQLHAVEESLTESGDSLQVPADQSLKVFAAGVAHDLNNILAIIFGYCSLAEMDYETAENHIPGIEIAAERAAELCRQMLVYAGKTKLVQSQVHMETLVNEMVKMLKSTINLNAVISLDFSQDIPFVTADASQIRQIVMNLIINASEAIGEEQGDISVSLTNPIFLPGHSDKDYLGKTIPAGVYVCLEVTDTGCGMNDETKRRIFEPFFTTKSTGRGLGMAATLGIITAHGGALQLVSQPGQGTTFKIYLPVQVGSVVGEESYHHVTSKASWKATGTILLVEDEAQITLIVKTMLKALGFTVIEASNGKEALELYHKNADVISFVMTDLSMPVMDGYELFDALKALNPKLPIVISSGYGEKLVTTRIAREDIAGLACKPYSFAQLREILKGVIEHLAATDA